GDRSFSPSRRGSEPATGPHRGQARIRSGIAVRRPAWLVIAATLQACVPAHPARVATPPPTGKTVQCQTQRVTGSLVATRVCTVKEQREGIQESTQEARDFLNRQVIGACPGTPGCK